MQIHILVLSLFFQGFFAYQQVPEKPRLSAANICFQSVAAGPQYAESAGVVTASGIVYKSADGGRTWQDVSAGLPEDLSASRVMADGGEITLCSERALYRTVACAGIPIWENEVYYDVEITDIFPGPNGPYISSYRNGIYKRIPGMGVLMPIHNNLKDKTVRSVLEARDGAVFVGCESGIFKSADGGNSWKQVFSGSGVNSFAEAEGVLVCGTYEGLLRSTDGGEHWDQVLTEEGPAFKTGFMNGRFVSITQGGKDWRNNTANRLRSSADGGKTWQRMDESLSPVRSLCNNEVDVTPIRSIYDVKQAGQYLFCSCDAGVFRSSDWGKSWEPVFASKDRMMLTLAVSGDVIYAVKVVGC